MEQSSLKVGQGNPLSPQQLTSSISAELQDPKNSRILNRKQIQRRLQTLKPAEYEKVIYNLTSQNKILQTEVRQLHKKVEQLVINKKIVNPHQKNPLMQEQVKKTKKQLALKYESMNYLKEQLRKVRQSQLTDDMRHRIKQQKNETINIELEIEKLQSLKQSLLQDIQLNNLSLEEYHPKQFNHDQRIGGLRQENKTLKTKIQQFNQNSKVVLKNSQEALQKFYNLKQEQQKFMKVLLQSKNSKKKLTMTDIKEISVTQANALEKQVQSLKKLKKEAEKQLVSEKIMKDQKKLKLEKQARDNLEAYKQLMIRRMKALNELNLYEAKDKKHREIIVLKAQQQKQFHFQERGCQTDKIVSIDFRKEWLGKNDGLVFDDSLILDYRSHVFIKSLIIYKCPEYISFIKFFYENNHKKRYESKVPFDSGILRKMESKKYSSKGNAYLKKYKISLTSERVTKIEFTWSDGQEVVEGWETEASTKFNADIDPDERPISMFGTLSFQGKNYYALQSLGCQINKIDTED